MEASNTELDDVVVIDGVVRVGITLQEWNDYKAYDSSDDSSHLPQNLKKCDINDNDELDSWFGDEPIGGERTMISDFTADKEADEFEMTSSQESQLPLEPTNYNENRQGDSLSDEDGEDVNLIETRTRYLVSAEEKSAQEAIQNDYNGETTRAHDITWTVKFDFEEINRQGNDQWLITTTISSLSSPTDHRQEPTKTYATMRQSSISRKFLGLMIAGACCVPSGRQLWEPENSNLLNYNFLPNPDYGQFMSRNKFNFIRSNFTYCYAKFDKNGTDPWWLVLDGIENFNKIRNQLLRHAPVLVVDESMSAWVPKTTARGGLPNITYVQRKPETLGTVRSSK